MNQNKENEQIKITLLFILTATMVVATLIRPELAPILAFLVGFMIARIK